MQKIFLHLLTAGLLFLFSILNIQLTAQKTPQVTTIVSHTKLKKIPASVHEPFSLYTTCKTVQPNTKRSEEYFFENATIGKIKICKFHLQLQGDTLKEGTIYLSGQKSFDQARKQAIKQFGPATFLKNGNTEIFSWTYPKQLSATNITLSRKSGEWGAEMRISPLH